MSSQLYFAYGSNLNLDDLRQWCQRNGFQQDMLRFRQTAFLPDHEVRFSRYSYGRSGGVLDIVPRGGCIVPGVLFEVCGAAGWEALDCKEGAPTAYQRQSVVVLDKNGREASAITYAVLPEHRERHVMPSTDYVQTVIAGLDSFGLSVHLNF